MSMDLNKTYERVISNLIVPKHNFITGVEKVEVEKDEIDRVSIKVNFYLSGSWANTMFTSECRKKFIEDKGQNTFVYLLMSEINNCVNNGFNYEKEQIVKDLETLNIMLGYKTNYYKVSFDIRFVIDFDN
jgi:hypothetical protein